MIDGWKVEDLPFQQYLEGHTDDIVGEGNSIDYDFQSTLDPWRSYSLVEKKLEETDDKLREEYGSGIDFAMIYGSTTKGFSIFSDSFLSKAHEPGDEWFDESDIDVIVGLEDADEDIDSKLYRQDAAAMIYQNCREDRDEMAEYPEPKVHPLVHKSSFLVDTLGKARENWLATGGDDKEEIRLKGQPKEDAVYEMNQKWHNLIRGFMKGVAFPEEYHNSEFYDEIEKGKDILLEDGSLRDDVEFDVSSEASYFGSNRPNRADKLNRNHLYGLWDLAKRRNEVEFDHRSDRPFRQMIHHIIDREFDDRELGEMFDYKLQNASSWADDRPEEEIEQKKQVVREALESNTEILEDLMYSEFLEDEGFSQHNNVTEDLTVRGLEGDYEGLINTLYRSNGYYDNFEIRLASELVTSKIKQRYESVENEEFDIDREVHEITLGDLIEIEEEARFGRQSELEEF